MRFFLINILDILKSWKLPLVPACTHEESWERRWKPVSAWITHYQQLPRFYSSNSQFATSFRCPFQPLAKTCNWNVTFDLRYNIHSSLAPFFSLMHWRFNINYFCYEVLFCQIKSYQKWLILSPIRESIYKKKWGLGLGLWDTPEYMRPWK